MTQNFTIRDNLAFWLLLSLLALLYFVDACVHTLKDIENFEIAEILWSEFLFQ